MIENAIHMRVTGLVQGVGFRAYVKARADERGIRGWVRNQPDGSVHVLSILPEGTMESWIEAVRQGPVGSIVEGVEVRNASPDDGITEIMEIREFRIERGGT